MDTIASGQIAQFKIPTNTINAVAATASLRDAAGAALLGGIEVDQFVPGDEFAIVTVAAEHNTLGSTELRVGRVLSVELTVTDPDGDTTRPVTINHKYIVESRDVLSVPSTSFVTLMQGEVLALDMVDISGWDNASDPQKIAALTSAKHAICKITFKPFVNSGIPQDRVIDGGYSKLDQLSAGEFSALPELFLAALRRAQVIEASVLLAGGENPMLAAGMISETVGEVKQTFKQSVSRPLDLPISRRALKELSGFVVFGMRIAR